MKIDPRYDQCKCGNWKYKGSKKCRECFIKNKRKQISRLSTKWETPSEISKKIISANGLYN